jgi:hypothetical protein
VLLESNREFDDAPVGVIPAEAGIQDSWMPDQVGHDNARAGADSSQFQHSHGERMGSRDTAFNFCFIPTELSGMAIEKPDISDECPGLFSLRRLVNAGDNVKTSFCLETGCNPHPGDQELPAVS